jgi:hypothetical protein
MLVQEIAMNDIIKDRDGRKIAYLRDEGDSVRLYDSQHRTVGWYSKTRDVTMTAAFKIIGSGNQLMRLIPAR